MLIKIRKGLLFFFSQRPEFCPPRRRSEFFFFRAKKESREDQDPFATWPACRQTGAFAPLREQKKRMSRKEEETQRNLTGLCSCLPAARLASRLLSLASRLLLLFEYRDPLNGKMDFSLEQFENPIN